MPARVGGETNNSLKMKTILKDGVSAPVTVDQLKQEAYDRAADRMSRTIDVSRCESSVKGDPTPLPALNTQETKLKKHINLLAQKCL